MLQFWETHIGQIFLALLFSLIGIAMFGLAFTVIRRLFPFNVYKELEEDQNIALGIVLASVMLGLSIIIAAAIHS